MSGTERRTVIITGGSSGIGAATAAAFVRAGWQVYELSRREHQAPGVVHVSADITDPAQVAAAVEHIAADAGHIDVLVNNAGCGISGAAEFTGREQAAHQLNVNLLGLANVTSAVLPHLRASRGRVISVSSVAAVIPIPFQAWYSASKAAINAYTLALANEVRPFGVTACVVQPGDIRTGFTAARAKEAIGDDIYGGVISRSVAKMERDEQNGMAPERVARAILRIAERRRVQPLNTVGFGYQLFALLAKLLPRGLSNRIVGSMYGGKS